MATKRKAPKGTFWRGDTLWGRSQIKGRDIKWSLRTDDPNIAQRRFKEGQTRAIAELHYGDHRRTFAEVLEAWGKWIAHQVGTNTQVRYAVSLGQLRPFLDGLYLDEVDGSLVADIIRQRTGKVTNATLRRDLGALSSVIGFAIDQEWRDDNPVLPKMARLKERRDPIVLPEAEDIRRVITVAPGMFGTMIHAAWKTGCREDELASAKRSQIDQERRQLTVRGKGNKVRVIDLDGWGHDIFADLPVAVGQAYLFFHHQGEPYRNVASRFRAIVVRVAKQAQNQEQPFRPFRFHDLRHRHAVDWLKSGRSIYDLQQRLGHTSVKTTEIYLRYLTPEEKRVAMYGQEQKPEQVQRFDVIKSEPTSSKRSRKRTGTASGSTV
jgi:integrase/recombinase XerD